MLRRGYCWRVQLCYLSRNDRTTLAKDIVSPLLIVQGLNDPRVPVTEAEQIRDLVRRNGVPVWYALAKEEGHVFKQTHSKVFCRTAMMFFLIKYLGLELTEE